MKREDEISRMFNYKWVKRSFLAIILIIVLFAATAVYFNKQTQSFSRAFTFSEVTAIPFNNTALVLGTSQHLSNGKLNPYFTHRMEAAAALYKAGKVNYLIVSGDNSVSGYNEPLDMKNDLVKKGVPAEKIYLDYAGFRTFDSVIRAREIFGQTNITIVSQKFHAERAIYIARHEGINSIGFEAQDVDLYHGFTTEFREYLARTKMFIDLYLLPAKPHFLGEKIPIGTTSSN